MHYPDFYEHAAIDEFLQKVPKAPDPIYVDVLKGEGNIRVAFNSGLQKLLGWQRDQRQGNAPDQTTHFIKLPLGEDGLQSLDRIIARANENDIPVYSGRVMPLGTELGDVEIMNYISLPKRELPPASEETPNYEKWRAVLDIEEWFKRVNNYPAQEAEIYWYNKDGNCYLVAASGNHVSIKKLRNEWTGEDEQMMNLFFKLALPDYSVKNEIPPYQAQIKRALNKEPENIAILRDCKDMDELEVTSLASFLQK